MGRKSKLKAIRRDAERYTAHLPDITYHDGKTIKTGAVILGECTRGAYKALKRGKVRKID